MTADPFAFGGSGAMHRSYSVTMLVEAAPLS
jgi:hypothetical protein